MSASADTFEQAGALVDQLYLALSNKDLDAARGCCAPDVRIWHCFDGIAQDLEQAMQGWRGLFDFFLENRVVDVRRAPLPGGLVQRHLFLLRGADGVLRGKPCCIFARVENGLLVRLDEYIDLSGEPTVGEDESATAGLPPAVIV